MEYTGLVVGMIRSDLKNACCLNIGVGFSFQILNIFPYACGLK